MNITITIPKGSLDTWLIEADDAKARDLICNFKTSGVPKNIALGEKVYVIHDGAIIGYHTYLGTETQKEFTCETSGKQWSAGYYITREGASWTLLNPPIASKGHQGIRYTELDM